MHGSRTGGSSSRAASPWGRADGSGPAVAQRVLRRRDSRRGMQDSRDDRWQDEDSEHLGHGESQGKAVLLVDLMIITDVVTSNKHGDVRKVTTVAIMLTSTIALQF